ncbi:MAG: hypothetical protein R6V23_12960 [Bacteroidales bacterium]
MYYLEEFEDKKRNEKLNNVWYRILKIKEDVYDIDSLKEKRNEKIASDLADKMFLFIENELNRIDPNLSK